MQNMGYLQKAQIPEFCGDHYVENDHNVNQMWEKLLCQVPCFWLLIKAYKELNSYNLCPSYLVSHCCARFQQVSLLLCSLI